MQGPNVIHAMDARSIEDRIVSNVMTKYRKVTDILYERNGEVNGIRLLMRYCYGGSITNTEKDELLICSRLAQRG